MAMPMLALMRVVTTSKANGSSRLAVNRSATLTA